MAYHSWLDHFGCFSDDMGELMYGMRDGGVDLVFLGGVALAGFDGGPCVTSWWVVPWEVRSTAEQI